MIKGMHDQNVKFMISVWHNPQGTAREELRTVNGLLGEWIDVFNPKAREVRWKTLNNAFFSIGMDAWWNDATEPGDPGEGLTNQQTAMGSGDRLRNAYPLLAAQGVYEGQRSTTSSKRVVNLTRSAYLGMQRYGAAAWSGDVNGDWETFKRQIPAGLNFCLTGIPYWTTDAGGFFHPRGQYTSEDFNQLLTRWFQWNTFSPILRIHGYETETEMWKWLPETQKILLDYDKSRYRLLPYNYSVAWKVTNEGYTIMRALPMDFRTDARVANIGDQYMFGPSFLVTPVTEANVTSRKVYLPAGTQWFNFWTGETAKGGQTVETPAPLETLPLWVRAGSIVPMGPDLQWANEKPADPIELRVYRGANGVFNLYEDEGDSYNYERGVYSTIPIRWDERAQRLTIGARKGSFPGMLAKRTFRVVWVGRSHGVGAASEAHADTIVNYSGRATTVQARKG
jgi:alpha-D-xyloside xylohydrolase